MGSVLGCRAPSFFSSSLKKLSKEEIFPSFFFGGIFHKFYHLESIALISLLFLSFNAFKRNPEPKDPLFQ
ncbi:Uncharacterized protein TCM_006087 isoform 2 [Theobroma cacao]|uniref:Uncharacterized protein isoform 2 n=1 Tax=Theobroma cacao TaxID=3641 RepID=A0A061E3V1_THECC|nr:Uncharacterized protein TCM_006087 isoform 2 [Theobroma cacao]